MLTLAELASMFPNRAGAEVVYLEQAYPRPRYLAPVAFAVTSVLLSFVHYRLPHTSFIPKHNPNRFSVTNSIVFAQYVLTIFDIPTTDFRQTFLALAVITFSVAGKSVVLP